jgi:hypothetical protein
MKRNMNKNILFFGVAIMAVPQLFTGCASPRSSATVREAENLIAARASRHQPKIVKTTPDTMDAPAEGPAFAASPWIGPSETRVDTSRKHLFELYAGQQEIINALEGSARAKKSKSIPAAGPSDEGPPSDLPSDISNEDLLNILRQQQKLIKALTDRKSKHVSRT